MWLASDRQNFWDASQLSSQTEWKKIDEEDPKKGLLDVEGWTDALEDLEGRRCLLFIHGFDDNEATVLTNYLTLHSNLTRWVTSEDGNGLYDRFIGYVWPGCSSFLEYFKAEKNALQCAPRLKNLIVELSKRVARLDVFAHSMGNRLLLESLNEGKVSAGFFPVQHFYSMAPAVNHKALDEGHFFHRACSNIGEIAVFFSSHDPVEEWFYPLAEFARALGTDGDASPLELPTNVQTIDCTALVSSHGDYYKKEQVYEWIRRRLTGQIEGPEAIQDMVLQSSGEVIVKLMRGGGEVVPQLSNQEALFGEKGS